MLPDHCDCQASSQLAESPHSLLEEPRRYFWAPDSQRLVAGRTVADGGLAIDNIAVDVVLDHVMRGIPPIVEDLRPEDMSANPPDGFVALLA